MSSDETAHLRNMFDADQREHANVPPMETTEYGELRERDRARRIEAEAVLARLRASADGASPEALYHVAWLLNHGELPAEAQRAHELAREAADSGYAPARWLSAAAYDRWCMYEGRPQKYGTQFVPDGVRYRLWDLDPDITDAERARYDVPSLAEQLRRADEMTRTESQPPLDRAPDWLKAALERWKSSGHTHR